jgi:S1-C subfamily serine protease
VSQTDGTFVMTQVPEGELRFLASPWEVVSPTRFTMTRRSATVELEVKPLALLRGVVTRAGRPVAGATVQAQSAMQRPETVTDAKGQYVLRGLNAGAWTVYGSSERVGAFVEAKVTLAAREEKELNLELSSAAAVAGHVVDESGQPVAGAYVVYSLPRTGDEGRSITDADGRFECNLMTGGGEYQPVVYTSATSRVPYKPVKPPLPGAKLNDGSSRVEGVTLAVKYERLTLSGRVVDTSGAPVPDVRVRASSGAQGSYNFSPWVNLPLALTDGSGAFTVDGLTSGSWGLQARAPDGAEATVNDLQAGAKDVVITVRPPGGIEGTLRGYREPPVVYARASGQERFQAAQVEGATFRIQLPAGSYVVTAMNLHEGDAQRVEVREGAMTKVTMTSRGQGSIHGVVLEHGTRAPISGLICHTVVRAGAEPGITNWDENLAPKTGADGKFVVEPAPAGDVSVSCFGDWAALSSASAQVVVPQGGNVEVSLEAVRRGGDAPGDVGLAFESTPQVTQVVPRGAGAAAGVLPGDVVTAIDGVPVGALDGSGVSMLILNHPPGTQLTLDVLRGTQPRKFTLVTTAQQ